MAGKKKKRLRIFAGPNGSGKSTLYQNFPKHIKIGIYVNADEIEAELHKNGQLDLQKFNITSDIKSLRKFLNNHPLKENVENVENQDQLKISENIIFIHPNHVSSYWAAMLSDFIRKKLVQDGKSLSFETVMSNPDKLDFIKFAKKKGYKIYLYYLCTEDPDINIDRIHYRVNANLGHYVQDKKVKDRYFRSLEQLLEAISLSYRGYLFDNTGERYRLCAEKTPKVLKVCGHKQMPVWLYQFLLIKNFEAARPLPLRKLS